MRSICGRLALAASIPMLAPQLAAGDEVQAQLQQMNERILQLEQQLQATDDELEATSARAASQQEILERAGLGEGAEARSALSRFLTETEFDGWVAANYWYNANNPSTGRDGNIGNPQLGFDAKGLVYPLHPDHNTFEVGQVWFKMSKHATAESRGGFGVDVVYGKTADALSGSTTSNGGLSNIFQAYAEYLAPLGPGIRVTAGRFASAIGTERVETVENFNVTQGLVRTQLQPFNHVGVKLESRVGPVRLMVGAANDAMLDLNSDVNDGKTLLWGVGFDVTDTISIDTNGLWGDSATVPTVGPGPLPPGIDATSANRIGIVDAAIRWDPSDLLAAWIDFTYVWTDDLESIVSVPPGSPVPPATAARIRVPGNPRAYGLAAASRYMFAASSAVGLRLEGIFARDNFLDPLLLTGLGDQTIWSITGTLDHSFTEHFVVRVETRYDRGEVDGSDAFFFQDSDPGTFRKDQFVAGVEAYYRF